MKLLLFVAILVVSSFGQGDDGGGCCFYAQKNFQEQIVCTSQPVRNTKPVQSWFCTEGFAANLVKQKVVLAPVLCGDTLPETSRPVDADEIHVFTPCPRFSDCCFYTESNNAGEEVCIPGDPAPGKVFKSFQCLPGWRPKVKGGQALPCPRPGVAVSFAAPVKHADLETEACEEIPVEPVAETVFEAGAANSDLENSFNGDAATAEQSLEDTNFFANLESNAPVENLEVTAETENLALEEDGASFATEDANFVAEGDFAMANEEPVVQQSGSTVLSATICLLVGAILLA